MRHRKKLQHLGLMKSHRDSLVKNLIASLVLHGKLRTTENRAKALAARFGKMMTIVRNKKDVREAIRLLPSYCHTEAASIKIIGELKKKYENRISGFTRIIRLGNRKGDNAKLVQIELI